MSYESDEVDLTTLFAAVLDYEGGTYDLPYDAFVKVAEESNKAISITLVDDGVTISLSLVDLEKENDLIVPGQ